MTNRSALIIYSDKSKYGNLPGAQRDAIAWREYLQSDLGGQWLENEITTLANPSKQSLSNHLSLMSNKADIGAIFFSGHGFHRRSCEIDSSFLCLNDREDIPVHMLNCGIPRLLIVADSCRGLEPMTKSARIQASLIERYSATSSNIRQRYEGEFLACEKGAIYMYSCDIDEAAGESATKGGYFSSSLITSAREWASAPNRKSPDSLSTAEAFSFAKARTKQLSPQQNPQYDAGRRLRHFPFAMI